MKWTEPSMKEIFHWSAINPARNTQKECTVLYSVQARAYPLQNFIITLRCNKHPRRGGTPVSNEFILV